MGRWVLVRSGRYLWSRFWREADYLPGGVWRRWFTSLMLGLGICALLTFAVVYWSKLHVDQGLQAWDASTLPVLAGALPLSFSRSITWESPGNLLGMLPVVITFTAIMVVRSQPLLAATMVIAYGLQFALVWIGWGYWNRGRPDLIADGVAASGLHSFPSGHTVVVITVHGLLAYLWFRAASSLSERIFILIVSIIWIGLIVSSRLVLGAHWPSDVVAGIFIGVIWLISVIWALHRAEAKL